MRKPLYHPLPYRENSAVYFLAVNDLPFPAWLDSGKPLSLYGRYDIISAAPETIFINNHKSATLRLNEINSQLELDDNDSPNLPFIGGAIGAFNYDYLNEEYGLDAARGDQAHIAIYQWALVVDHKEKKTWLVTLPSIDTTTLCEIQQRLLKSNLPVTYEYRAKFSMGDFQSNLSFADYCEKVRQIYQYILEGDAYQINFSQCFSGEFSGDSLAAFLSCRTLSPSPYSAFLPLENRDILCLSPERFVSLNGTRARAQPIKGTVKRGSTPQADKKAAQWLIESEKNRAENIMIVDLLRNDFNRSCIPLSVKAPELCMLRSFANVHHLVSTITGELRENVTALEFLLNCFPGGSITGAPKKRAMEIIFELEGAARGIYCGSVFYQSIHGRLDSNIAIRTLEISKGKVRCAGGGGITIDSIVEEEYQESIDKIEALLNATK